MKAAEAVKEPATEHAPGDWVKAIKPGWIDNAKFVKAGDKFQLTESTPFSDTWMEKTDAPEVPKEEKADIEAEQRKAVRDHEETDRIRRGKFSFRSVPRSDEGKEEQAKRARKAAPTIDRGRAGHHETSANPSRVDENARRK
jgi:hypothetical protein